MIDLRSDTVTRPTDEMRQAMATAEVGDDQFGEDPSVNRLQDKVADLLGKEAALWLPTGTMANQVTLKTLTQPGDDVIVPTGAHVVWSETGAGAANSGVQFTELGGSRGYFDVDEFRAAVKPRGHIIMPPTTVVALENTHNRAGGRIVPLDVMSRVCEAAAALGLVSYMDGARIWNAAVATGRTPADLAAPFDLVWVAFSKGLGAPGGSMLAGSAETIRRATRYRRMLGGAMRQVGIFAAAASHALDHNMESLAGDHANATEMARILAASDRILLDAESVETNIIYFSLSEGGCTASQLVERAADRGVLSFAMGANSVRVVTHRDLTRDQCREGARILVEEAER
ncbi:MAG: GntG family PLP-dependent aldolase [Acidimicrobiia bacterium]